MIGIIGRASLLDTRFVGKVRREHIENRYGRVLILRGDGFVFIPRHGAGKEIPPHRINYKANIATFKDNDIENIVGINSVGSLKKRLKVGFIIVPNDYMSLCNIPTYFDSRAVHITPKLDEDLRRIIIKNAKELNLNVIENGIYFQTHGPRLETKAEIRFIRDYADVVGMTMASEATLADELGLKYASICTIDNYAHGVVDEELNFEEVVKRASKGRDALKMLLKNIITELNR